MVDVFEEVEDQIRTERYLAIGRRILPWAIGAGVAFVIGSGVLLAYDAWHKAQADKAAQTYMDAINAYQGADRDKAFSLFGDLSHSSISVYKVAGLMDQAAMRLSAGKTDDAVKLYDQAAKSTSDPALKDLARLKSALALMDTAPYAEIESRLKPLIDEKRPLHQHAQEAMAFAMLQAGKFAEARSAFNALTLSLGAPEGMQERAKVAIQMIDSGSAKAMPQAARDSLSVPPPAPSQFGPQGMPQGGDPADQGAQQ